MNMKGKFIDIYNLLVYYYTINTIYTDNTKWDRTCGSGKKNKNCRGKNQVNTTNK